jgi:hypothetical protein
MPRRYRRRPPETETLQVPHEYMQFADLRIGAIVQRCFLDTNVIESISRSCYLQGVWDGAQLAIARPELADQLREGAPMPVDRMLQFFAYAHLPMHLQEASKPFCELAEEIATKFPMNPERTVTLRKLLEAKDAAVRTLLYKEA